MIPFNRPPYVGNELDYIKKAIENCKISGDGEFTKKCSVWLQERFGCNKVLLTTSCSHALDMTAILANIQPGDEVIMPSFTFVSTANGFVMRGAKIVFVDIRPDTMNIDETLIEKAITKRTKAIVVVHYAGVACEMKRIMEIANKYNLLVIEDAAQGVMSTYKGKALGTIGDMGCYSFHETKNYSMGEGGCILINNSKYIERAEIIREKGTNRSKFFRGEIDKYTWVDLGSSYLPSEINSAYLWAQLLEADKIYNSRMRIWLKYHEGLKQLEDENLIKRPYVPKECIHNAHMYYIKTRSLNDRQQLIEYLKNKEINAVFHYVPLHTSTAGKKFGTFCGEDIYTTRESDKLLRLPIYFGMEDYKVEYVIKSIYEYYSI